jgi:hypothetical protein
LLHPYFNTSRKIVTAQSSSSGSTEQPLVLNWKNVISDLAPISIGLAKGDKI